MKNLFVILFIIVFSSCANVKHSNFNRQKFTNLKTRTVDEDQALPETKSYDHSSETINQATEKNQPLEQVTVIEKSNHSETVAQNETITESKNEVNDGVNFQESEKSETANENVAHVSEPKAYSSDSADTAISKFHLLFQIGLMLFIISVLLFAMAWFAASAGMMVLCLIAADATILTVWIMSFVLINAGRKISKTDRDQRFKIEYGLAWFTACVGPLVGLGVIILGFIVVINHF